ncbi:MAG: DUF4013 domain-containing protein [Candidatus Eremiobacterota bacterium]
MDFQESLQYPLKDPGGKKKLLISGLFFMPGGLLIVPFLLPVGFALAALRRVIKGEEDKLPEWEYFADYFKWGLMCAVITFVYGLVPGTLAGLSIVPMLGAMFGRSAGEGATLGLVGVLGIILTILAALLVNFVLPMALTRYATTENLGSAFAIGEIFGQIRAVMGSYVKFVLLCIGLMIVTHILVGLFNLIPLLGVYPTGVLLTYSWLVLAHYLGRVYRQHFGSEVSTSIHSTEGVGMNPDRWNQAE